MRQLEVQSTGFPGRTVSTVVALPEIAACWQPSLNFLVPVDSDTEVATLRALQRAGLDRVVPVLASPRHQLAGWDQAVLTQLGALELGDVVAVTPQRRHAEVLMRRSDRHHTVFLTNRCNSRCLMCSQPPTPADDAWRIAEALRVADQLLEAPPVVGFTGGEPLLLGEPLRHVLDAFCDRHPDTALEVLTNGRLASDTGLARSLFDGLPPRVTWMVPLYGHAPFLHDYVVQAAGAFDETIAGLLNLQHWGQRIQLRVVLIRPVLEVLPGLCDFIARNLPFVHEVALMGCEPIGYALAHRDECEVDLRQWEAALQAAVRRLVRGGLPVVLMNTPLCSLPSSLWRHAHRSISDWKQAYAPQCAPCIVKERCSGLFAWYERGWTPSTLRPITLEHP